MDIDKQKDFDSVLQKYKLQKSKSLNRSNSITWITIISVFVFIVGLLVFNNSNQDKKNEEVLSDIEIRSAEEFAVGLPEPASELAENDSLAIEKTTIPENIDQQNGSEEPIEPPLKPTGKQKTNDLDITALEELTAASEVLTEPSLNVIKEEKETEEQVDIMLEDAYPVAGFENLYSWFERNITYPEEHRKDAIEGYVKVSFLLAKDSTISDIRINQSLGPAFDQEAIRLIDQMPKWAPAKRGGIPFSKRLILPIGFKIESR
jgi:TonB family protein